MTFFLSDIYSPVRDIFCSDDLGEFVESAGKFYVDELESRGLQTSQDAKKYAISTKLDDLIDNTDKTLVVQFSVKHEQNIDCGGGYIKLLPEDFDPLNFNGDSKYNIMFGPDICGPKRKIHLIFQYKGENKLINKNLPTPYDQLTHLFTLIVKPDHVLVDNKEEASGNLEDDFDFLPPKEINDPDAKKPEDWVDDELIIDPNDTKPEDWKDVPQTIPDPDAEKPDDWDDESDGDWEAPHISNPDYQGEWKPKMIKNPLYKGPWKQPKISNPDYKPDPSLHAYKTLYVGFELWQVKSGTIFDNILITDDVEFASTFANQTFEKFREQEIEAKEKLDSSETIKVSDDPDEEDLDLDSDLTDDITDSFNGKDDKKLNVQDNQDNQEILRA
nr:14784_t:CDS:2 [Entrophospora candida]